MPGLVFVASVSFLVGCGELGPESEAIQEQQFRSSTYGPGQAPMIPLSDSSAAPREPVPGEVPDR